MKLKENYLLHEMDNEAVLIDITNQNRNIIKLNYSATTIVRMLKEGIDVKDIAKEMLAEYDVEESALLSDIDKVIKILKDNGVLA